MDTISNGTDVSRIVQERTACSNRYYETAASPTALSAVSREAVLVRDIGSPIQFPFTPYQLVELGD